MGSKLDAESVSSTGTPHSTPAGAPEATPRADPLILTARFDATAAATFQRLRDRHFPAQLNIVPAHCTLFHHLPGAALGEIGKRIATRCRAEAPCPFVTPGLRFLGRGVALEIAAPGLLALRASLAAAWAEALTAQDRQGFRPHVTIQNKADPAAARALRDGLMEGWVPVEGRIDGLDLWHYRGGPWQLAGRFTFGG